MESFIELCKNRRSFRRYTEQTISHDQIEQILQCALMSPAGKRLNPWEFVVVEDKEVLTKLSTCREHGSQMLAGAPLGIVVVADPAKSDTWMYDASIAAHNIQLAATDLGLGACWCHIHQRENAEQMVRKLLGIPENLNVLCIMSIGYKNEERKQYDVSKLAVEKIHYGKY